MKFFSQRLLLSLTCLITTAQLMYSDAWAQMGAPNFHSLRHSGKTMPWCARLALGTIANDDFLHYQTGSLAVERRFREMFAVRASYTLTSEDPTGLTNALETVIDLKRADIQEFIKNYSQFEGVFRFKTQSTQVTPYAGIGVVSLNTRVVPGDNPEGEEEAKWGHSFLLGLEWSLSAHLGFALELNQIAFEKYGGCGGDDDSKGLEKAYNTVVSLGMERCSTPINIALAIAYGF